MACNFVRRIQLVAVIAATTACASGPVHGPDKTFIGEATGALEGAGAGAVTGFQIGAGAGPGAAVGAGFGAVAGAIQGMVNDSTEDWNAQVAAQAKKERIRAVAQETLADHYRKRMELHPTRDIYPADLFFIADSAKLCTKGRDVIREIAKLSQWRLPYSRIVVATYAKASQPDSSFAQYLTEQRAKVFVNELVRAGVEPRRLETRPVVVDAPVLIDPLDNPSRYNQAIEIIAVDR